MSAENSGGISGFFKKHIYDSGAPNEQPTPNKPNLPTSSKTAPTSLNSAISFNSSSYDPDMLKGLSENVLKNKTPYTALLEASERLVNTIPDETTRIKAAFAFISGGRSASDVIQSIDIHLQNVESERMKFKAASDQQVREKSQALRDQAQQIEADTATKQKQIEALHKQIADLGTAITTNNARSLELTSQADNAEANIRDVEARFNRTVEYLKSDLTARKQVLAATIS